MVRAYQHKNADLHGYILNGKRELIAQNQALERADKGKFRLELPSALSCMPLLAQRPWARESGCLRSDESKLTNHNCYLNSDHQETHRPTASVDVCSRLVRRPNALTADLASRAIAAGRARRMGASRIVSLAGGLARGIGPRPARARSRQAHGGPRSALADLRLVHGRIGHAAVARGQGAARRAGVMFT